IACCADIDRLRRADVSGGITAAPKAEATKRGNSESRTPAAASSPDDAPDRLIPTYTAKATHNSKTGRVRYNQYRPVRPAASNCKVAPPTNAKLQPMVTSITRNGPSSISSSPCQRIDESASILRNEEYRTKYITMAAFFTHSDKPRSS